VAYPESVAEDWLDQIKLSGLQCAISPLHDKDVHSDPSVKDGKKPHWHVIVCWGNNTTPNAVATFTEKLKATIPVKLESVKGYYRYFTHMDDPDKYQYDAKKIKHIGGFNPLDFTEITRGEVNRLLWDVQAFIDDNDIREYGRLLHILKQTEQHAQWEAARTNTLFLNTYITSRRHELEALDEKLREEAKQR
jgi:hypothetical protein